MPANAMAQSAGKVYLVGAGPGDPGLITVRGVECLERADVVVYDYLSNPTLLRYARADAEILYAGKQASQHTLPQDEINALLVKLGKAGKLVTRLKGGDPFVFGRGGEEAEALHAAGIPFEIVPGISSAIAAPAYAGIPVTHRAVAPAFMVITGHEDPTKTESQVDWKSVAGFFGTRVILMGVERIGVIAGVEGVPVVHAAATGAGTIGMSGASSGQRGRGGDLWRGLGLQAAGTLVDRNVRLPQSPRRRSGPQSSHWRLSPSRRSRWWSAYRYCPRCQSRPTPCKDCCHSTNR